MPWAVLFWAFDAIQTSPRRVPTAILPLGISSTDETSRAVPGGVGKVVIL